METQEKYDEAKMLLGITTEKIKNYNLVKQEINKNYALDFNPIHSFFPLNENKLSSIIAFFLDPNETHYQGDIYAKSFIEFLLQKKCLPETSIISSHCEYRIDNKRRIDILLKYKVSHKEYVIAIENKIWAKDQPDQISDYYKFLQSNYAKEEFLLIYWNPYSNSPSKNSVPELLYKSWPNFKILDHSTSTIKIIEQWLQVTKPISIRTFMDNVLNFLQIHINDHKYLDMSKGIEDLITGDSIQAARLINESLQGKLHSMSHQFVDGVARTMNELAEANEYKLQINGKINGSNIYYEFINEKFEITSRLRTEYPGGLWIEIINLSTQLDIDIKSYNKLLKEKNLNEGGFDDYTYWQYLGKEDKEVSEWYLNKKGFDLILKESFWIETGNRIFNLMDGAYRLSQENSLDEHKN